MNRNDNKPNTEHIIKEINSVLNYIDNDTQKILVNMILDEIVEEFIDIKLDIDA
jgi:hypothetical protein